MYRLIGADGVEYGPVPAEQLRLWIAQGRANAQSRVRLEGEAEWRALESIPELASALTAPPARAGGPWAPPGAPSSSGIQSYLVWSILATLFCCVPLGIPALVYAAQVDGKVVSGDLAGALESSRKARLWCLWAAGVGGGFVFLYLLVFLIAAANA
jgi:hypothetical protein